MDNRSFSRQIVTLLAVMLLFTLLALIPMFLFNRPGVDQWRMLMALTVIQNIGIFIIPAFITARIFNNGRTLQVLQLSRSPRWGQLGMMLLIYFASIPMMETIVTWNEGMHLPDALAGVESWMREREDAAALATEQMMDFSTIGQLITIIFTVGILTGMGEELIFRGSIQRLMIERNINIHVAIWVSAFLFSAIHMQFFGFVPRMLLGAFFGYLAVWSGSMWLPILAHALNNSLAIIGMRYSADVEAMPWIGTPNTITAIASMVVTIALLYCYLRWMRVKK